MRELKKLLKTFAMVHSKVVVVDPFGSHPTVLTGSHNLGPKASDTNDEIWVGNYRSGRADAASWPGWDLCNFRVSPRKELT